MTIQRVFVRIFREYSKNSESDKNVVKIEPLTKQNWMNEEKIETNIYQKLWLLLNAIETKDQTWIIIR